MSDLNDLDVSTPLDGAPASEVYAELRNIKAVLKNFGLTAHLPSGALRTEGGGVVTSGAITAGSVDTAHLQDGAVTSSKIEDGTIASTDLADSAVSTAKLADGAVTAVKINNGSVTEDKLATNAVGLGKLKSSTTDTERPVTTDTIKNLAVTNDKIASLEPSKLSGGAANSFLFHNGTDWISALVTGGLTFDSNTNTFTVDSGLKVATILDTKTTGTDGGGPAAPAVWNERDLGQGADPENIVTFVGNSFTLVTGDYMFYAVVPANAVGTHQARLLKTQDSDSSTSTAILGTSVTSTDVTYSLISGVFSVTDAADSYKIQHWTQNANATTGFGLAANSGENELYTTGWLVKLG